MEPHILFCASIILTISFFLATLPKSYSQEQDWYKDCGHPFNCGNLGSLYYPFWSENLRPPYCGRKEFQLYECQGPQLPSIRVGSQTFNVTWIDPEPYSYTMKMVRADLAYNDCSSNLTNTSLSDGTQFSLFSYGADVKNVTLFYDCPSNITIGLRNFTCQAPSKHRVYYVHENEGDGSLQQFPQLQQCGRRIPVPISEDYPLDANGGIDALIKYLNQGFLVNYKNVEQPHCTACWHSRGICGSATNNTSQFTCYCQDGAHASDCNDSHPSNLPVRIRNKVIVGVSVFVFTVIVMMIGFVFYKRRKTTSYAKSYIQSSHATSSDCSVVDTEYGSKHFRVPLFTYSELEEATNHFDASKELGDGGFGTVYFGKLRDGRYVAVKRLYQNNYKRVEQFMNEVEILTRLRHQSLVSLYGCTSPHSRELLLVYEFIPNGTVADHLHGERAKPGTLPWSIRMNIAIETASALTYLHASDVIHRDVKTNNILLDKHFCVKVADFGLSRLFPTDVTHISTAPQGTPGYVDPEYHECYQLTDKSDVYSFGVVLIELISSMPAVDITRHRHEINLATMAINKIQSRALHEMVDPTLGFESDYKVRKMINAVAELAFQCLQSMKDMRPSMVEVLDVLKDIQSDGQHKTKPEVMDISADDVVLLKNDLPPPSPSPDYNLASKSTTPNSSK